MGIKLGAAIFGLFLAAALALAALRPPAPLYVIGGYATNLAGRTPDQRFNARRAASRIDGIVVAPGAVFSFNQILGGWSRQKGYRKAPVSYNGILVDDYGGGVCQTSTTLYNAALVAGLPIIERHAHTFAPSYAPPGRDAAVAYSNVDLRFRNNQRSPIIIDARVTGGYVTCTISSYIKPTSRVTVESRILDTFAPPEIAPQPGSGHSRSRWQIKGRDGVRVATFRSCYDTAGNLKSIQRISDNTYRPISAAIWAN